MAKYHRILSIDGGGIRGILPGMVLVALEKKLQAASGKPDARIADYFDLIAGTSTGGILGLALLAPDQPGGKRPKLTAQQAVDIYLKRGGEIFHKSLFHSVTNPLGMHDPRYEADALEETLRDYLGNYYLTDLVKDCLIAAYDIETGQARFFTSRDAKEKKKDFLLWHVARSTSAAPTYFPVAQAFRHPNGEESRDFWPMIDGGVFANNPTLCAYAELRSAEPHPTAKDMVVLSLGTGKIKEKPIAYEEAKDWGAIGWATSLLNIMMDGVADTVDYQMQHIFESVDLGNQYCRIQTVLGKKPEGIAKMDNAEPDNLENLRKLGMQMAKEHDQDLDRMVSLLLEEA